MASFLHHLLLLLLLFFINPHFCTANITLTSSLTADDGTNSIWASPSGDFAFGFTQLNNLFLLSIWFNKIPSRTVVWSANPENPVPKGSKVQLSSSSLGLTDPDGQLVWEAKPAVGSPPISYASMLDSGNFVLVSNTSTSPDAGYLWESFRNPTDTILPNQTLNLGNTLYAKLTETNFSKGRFALRFSNGSLDLLPVARPGDSFYDRYYTSGTYSSNPSETGNRLVFNGTAQIYIVKGSGDVAPLRSWDFVTYRQDSYYRATLDYNGLFTEYSHPRNFNAGGENPSWLPVQSVPDNICLAFFHEYGGGPCGFNGICSIGDSSRPSCSCPPGYASADPADALAGCRPNSPQGCGFGVLDNNVEDPREVYEIRKVDGVDFPLNDYEKLQLDDESVCEDSCMRDCACGVAVYDGVRCWKKRLPLSNGRVWNNTLVRVMFKVRKDGVTTSSGFPEAGGSNGGRSKKGVLRALLGSSVAINGVMLLFGLGFLMRLKKRRVDWVREGVGGGGMEMSGTLRSFSYKELEEATDGFREELGRGSFGIVYKGVLRSGGGGSSGVAVAVKKLDKLAPEREREFKTEVNAIGRTHHKNLVTLLGYCDQASHRLLIYEYMSNGTLAGFLFALPRPEWHHRARIALGIARGLVYLHEECQVPIIHCDIKPHNILLDDGMTARISDFGLAKLLLSDHTRTKTVIRGTRGYVAPEWFKNVAITAKVDVYSFGVMLLEIVCCRKSVEMEMEESGEEEKAILTDWAYDCYAVGRMDLLVGKEEAAAAREDGGRLKKWVMIALWCIQEDPLVRPTMKRVVEMMEGYVEVPLLPFPSSCSTLGGHGSSVGGDSSWG
ncbi:unnamed protein product [Linum trigynum]|uniref:Receptor-like serine/threonine-protein kinase n=1 Tax=Linum trigynum TaxID=586398 RepID=A0AAV2DQU9_9ROSI